MMQIGGKGDREIEQQNVAKLRGLGGGGGETCASCPDVLRQIMSATVMVKQKRSQQR